MRDPALVVAGSGARDTSDETRRMVFDSRNLTFKYLDRSGYKNGVYEFLVKTLPTGGVPTRIETIPHGLGYAPSLRVFCYTPILGTPVVPGPAPVIEYAMIDPAFEASVPYVVGTTDETNVYLAIFWPVVGSGMLPNGNFYNDFQAFDLMVLVGADDLDSDPDETFQHE